jgi:type II secretory pathway predicted ATPase ExeA
MLKLKKVLADIGVLQNALAKQLELSPAAVAQIINHNHWPKGQTTELRRKILAFLAVFNAANEAVFEVEKEPLRSNATALNNTSNNNLTSTNNMPLEGDDMLLRKQTLIPAAKKLFGVLRNPFDDLQEADDMWVSPDIRAVREAMFQTAKNGGFLAVVGESGSGKTTIFMDLEERILNEKLPIILMKPYVLAAEDNDKKGKTLKVAHIAERMLRAIAPLAPMRISQEARFAQLEAALRDSFASGYRHCLVIEEAHSLPLPTLKHLKRILELRQGFSKLVSIILIGQPELLMKLSERNSEVREVVQRCEVVTLMPIESSKLADFLSYRLGRAGKKLSDVFDNSGIDMIIQRLVSNKGTSQLYPLAVGNFVVSAMNIAAQLGAPVIDADIVKEVV